MKERAASTFRAVLSYTCLVGAALALFLNGSGQAVAQTMLFGAANLGKNGPSTLYILDPITGVATPVGPIGFERVSGMDFRADGRLFATGERTDVHRWNHPGDARRIGHGRIRPTLS